jgi:hypothetical protein
MMIDLCERPADEDDRRKQSAQQIISTPTCFAWPGSGTPLAVLSQLDFILVSKPFKFVTLTTNTIAFIS